MARKKKRYDASFHKSKKINAGHPTYIFDKDDGAFYYIGLTHSSETDGIVNILLDKNPNPLDPTPSYIRPFVDKTTSNKLGRKQKGWKFSDSDKGKVNRVIKEHKKKK